MNPVIIHYEVKLLLINQSHEKEEVIYTADSSRYQLPKIGSRPPYYCNPRYERTRPVI
ncbi:hypothetical protein [Domibacillus indicus]|uniref:hypothetical protein n=1 Tax=Domibacillus indicus TaxID=1437523 RepID=UPI000A532D11|nr:hypothetical protein [Domibacillus indicus]